MIQLTEKAVSKIKEFADSEGLELSIRLKVVGSGCAGFAHDMEFDTNMSDMDEVIENNGIKIIIDPLSYQYLEDTTIDFIDSQFGSGFRFLSDKIKSTCGCGNSVSY